eukprot:3144236-Amphidinium_carterae.1
MASTPQVKTTKVDKEWDQRTSVCKLPKSVPGKKDVDRAVQKAILNSCKWATAAELDVVRDADGLTLRQRLSKDKAAVLIGGDKTIKFGRIGCRTMGNK